MTDSIQKEIKEVKQDLKEWDELKYCSINPEHVRKFLAFIESQQELIEHLQTEYAEERAAHNEHVTELCKAEELIEQLTKELELKKISVANLEHNRRLLSEEKERKNAEIEQLQYRIKIMDLANGQLGRITREAKEERDKYRLEAKNERELGESIVAEREELYRQVKQKDTEIERIEEKWKELLRVRMSVDNTRIWNLEDKLKQQAEEIRKLREEVERLRPKCCEYETLIDGRCMSCGKKVSTLSSIGGKNETPKVT